eukprot:1072222-Prymnesium_polylepis.1
MPPTFGRRSAKLPIARARTLYAQAQDSPDSAADSSSAAGLQSAAPVTELHTGSSNRGTGVSPFTKWVEVVELPAVVNPFAKIRVGDVVR